MLRFTIRDVLWLMIVVGMGAAWSVDNIKKRVDWREVEIREAYIHEQVRQEKRRADKAAESNAVLRQMLKLELSRD